MAAERVIEVPNEILVAEIKRSLTEGHTATFRVKGQSMRPFLENLRDVVKIERIVPELVRVNDVVLAEIAPPCNQSCGQCPYVKGRWQCGGSRALLR